MIKWRNIDKKTFKYKGDPEVETFKDDKEFRKLVKKYHPDKSDPFFKELNKKKMQKLLKDRKKMNRYARISAISGLDRDL